MIVIEREMILENDTGTIDKPVYLYRGDGNIVLILDIVEIVDGIGFGRIDKQNVITNGLSYATGCIYKPNNELAITVKAEIVKGRVQVMLIKDIMDSLEEVGEHKLQLHLYDEDINRMTLPAIPIQVLEPLCKDEHILPAIVDISLLDEFVSVADYDGVTPNPYESRLWVTGEYITAEKLNNMVKGIDDALGIKLNVIQLENNVIQLNKSKHQRAYDIVNGAEIRLPEVDDFIELHLYFDAVEDMVLVLPEGKYQTAPEILAGKTYEFIFTYVGEWLIGYVEYGTLEEE